MAMNWPWVLSVEKVFNDIVRANDDVDREPLQLLSPFHFDGERFNEGNQLLIDLFNNATKAIEEER